MPADAGTVDRFGAALRRLEQARRFAGPARGFWPLALEGMALAVRARAALLVEPAGDESSPWRPIALWPAAEGDEGVRRLAGAVGPAAAAAGAAGFARLDSGDGPVRDHVLVVRLEEGDAPGTRFALLLLPGQTPAAGEDALQRLRLLARLPAENQAARAAAQAQAAASQFAALLDLVGMLHARTRHLAAAMTLVNELASRHRCDRVSLGWLDRGVIVLQAISHLERFERKMQAAQDLERVMEEAVDQEAVVTLPPAVAEVGLITRVHAEFARQHGVAYLATVPLRHDGQTLGALTLERAAEPFGELELRTLTLAADLAAPRLQDLKRRDRWWGARLAVSLRERAARLLGPRHTGAKLLALAGAVVLAVLVFWRVPYRVEAPFTLQPRESANLAAPFDGFLFEVLREPGDQVAAGDALLSLDTRELLLQEAAAQADLERYRREAEKARAGGQLPEMRVAQAQADQAQAQLDLVRHRLRQAVLAAPFAGVVTEGDLRRRLGSPVRQGDLLMQVARLDDTYVEAAVPERFAPALAAVRAGEIAFASRPKDKFPVEVTLIEPAAQTRETGNVFLVRARPGVRQDWWRPGMTGVAKLDAGRRPLIWVLTHRTVDFLRLKLWW